MSAAGPAYVIAPNGTSFLGTASNGEPKVLPSTTAGVDSNSTGKLNTSLPALGDPIFAPLGLPSTPTVSLIAPAASIGKALDEAYPGEQTPNENQIDAWNASTGSFDAGFPSQINTLQILTSPIVADVGGTSTPYVVEGSALSDVRAIDEDGQEAPGFPKFTGGWSVGSSAFGIFGSLGTQVLVGGTRTGLLFVWQTRTPATSSSGPWPQAHHDLWNTGNLDSQTKPSACTAQTHCPVFPLPQFSNGYWEVASDGGLFSFGTAPFLGSMGGKPLNEPIVGMAAMPTGNGYWEVASDGGLFSFGTAPFLGSMGGKPLNSPIVGMAAMPTGKGYWEVASDGGLFSFGTAPFLGSMGGKPLNSPIVGMAAMPTGNGYWEVASDGGLFSFGTAPFLGSMGGKPLNSPMVGMASMPTGKGYWEVASDGGLFSFGTAPFVGSMGGQHLNEPIVGMAARSSGKGYWEVASDGGMFSFGTAPFLGSMGGKPLNQPIVGMTPI
jgi:hypothetical protein